MAPTIYSGKKRQARATTTTNIRRQGQGSHVLNQTLSNIVNYVAKGSMNPQISASFRIRTHNRREKNSSDNFGNRMSETCLNYNPSIQTSVTSAASHRRHQQFSSISDNAVISSTHSDTENSFDLRLANEGLRNDTTAIYGSNTNISTITPTPTSTSTSTSTSLSSSISSQNKVMSSSALLCEERRPHSYSSLMMANDLVDNDARNVCKNDNGKNPTLNKTTNQMHSNNSRKRFFPCDDFDSENADKEDGSRKRKNKNENDMSCGKYEGDGDTDIYTDESDSTTSSDSEKSVERKRGNIPLLRDKMLVKKPNNNNNNNINSKSFNNLHNTDGLLSIAIKTIKLVKRNQLLQQRLTQLQLETSEFIQSVLANPENRHFRENIKQEVQVVENV